jgi:hypothetical protein
MAAAGGGVAAKGAGTRGTRPGQTLIGGDEQGAQAIQDRNATGLVRGSEFQRGGATQLAQTNHASRGLMDLGSGIVAEGRQAVGRARTGVTGAANGLNRFESNADQVGAAVGQQTLDAGRAQALSLAGNARGGNLAAAFRDAQAANTQATAQAASQAQITAGQQQMQQDAMRLNAMQSAGGLRMGMLNQAGQHIGQGLGAQQAGIGFQQNVGSQLLGAGLQREGNFLAAQTGNEALQANLDQQQELARAADRRDKRAKLFALGGGLMGAGGSVMASGAGGGGG